METMQRQAWEYMCDAGTAKIRFIGRARTQWNAVVTRCGVCCPGSRQIQRYFSGLSLTTCSQLGSRRRKVPRHVLPVLTTAFCALSFHGAVIIGGDSIPPLVTRQPLASAAARANVDTKLKPQI